VSTSPSSIRAAAVAGLRLGAHDPSVQYVVELKPRRKVGTVKLREAIDFQARAVSAAAIAAHEQLDRLGIRHAFVGGLAVGAHGYVRATVDIDFLVGAEAFEEHPGGIVTFRAGVPIEVGGVSIDYLTVAQLGAHVENALTHPVIEAGLPVVPVDVLVYTKLVAHRMRDRADVTELLKRGTDADRARDYLSTHAPDLLPRFDALAEQAARE
jgi:hypothetical protein